MGTSVKCAKGSSPLRFDDQISLMIAASRLLARKLPANSQFLRPSAIGRIRFSIQVLSIHALPSVC